MAGELPKEPENGSDGGVIKPNVAADQPTGDTGAPLSISSDGLSSGALDATTDEPGTLAVPTVLPPAHDDISRRHIAYWLLGLLTALVVGAFAGYISLFFGKEPPTFEQFKTLLELILTPLITLVSAATGFYFGAATKK